MKVETTVTLSNDLLQAIDQLLEQKDRSEFIEAALWAFIAQTGRAGQDDRDLEIINQAADRLNQEALDVLSYQVEW